MSYLKLNVSRALIVVPSDSIGIPNIASKVTSGSATATTANKLVDSAKTFISSGVKIGDIIYNTTDNTVAKVTALDSETTLSVSANIFATGEGYSIFGEEEKNGCIFMTGNHGSASMAVRVLTAGNDDVILDGLKAGEVFPIQVKKIFATGTDASKVVALW
jgi:hypothetical protein